MRRRHIVCKSCGHRRMRLVGKSWKMIRRPQAPTEHYYECPNCGKNWSYDLEQNALRVGIPPEFARNALSRDKS